MQHFIAGCTNFTACGAHCKWACSHDETDGFPFASPFQGREHHNSIPELLSVCLLVLSLSPSLTSVAAQPACWLLPPPTSACAFCLCVQQPMQQLYHETNHTLRQTVALCPCTGQHAACFCTCQRAARPKP